MEDPFHTVINAYCHYSTSQEELLKNSLLAREDTSPEPSPSPPSPAFDGNGIIICSAPETPASETVASPSGDEFKTPPEESRRSSSEEAPPQPNFPSSHGGESDGPGTDGGHGTPAFNTNCVASDAGTPDIGLSQEGNRTPKMVEILSDGKVRVGEVSEVDLDSFRVGNKRWLPVEESPPSKKIRVSVDLSATEEGEGLEKNECPIEIEVNVNMDVETEECDVDCGIGEADQIIDTEVIEDLNNTEQDCANNGGIPNVQQEQEKEEEEGTVVDGAEDLSMQGRRGLPASWGSENGGKREGEKRPNTERASGNGMGVVMEVLQWLAQEEREKRCDHGSIDFLETAKRRGVTFPEPKWWYDNQD